MNEKNPGVQADQETVTGIRGSNQSGMRAHNERLVLSILRRLGPMAKADIARMTGLSAQTVSVIMRALETDGLLAKGEPVRGRVGQPSVPMGLARPDGKSGNAVAGFVCPLGTHLDDPRERLAAVSRVSARAKRELSAMTPDALNQLALLGLSPLILGQMTGLLPKIPPFFNFVISNVVLSKQPLYLMGAELEAMYPVSFLFDGYALNITLVGYCDKVAVGFLGCREAVPSLQRLAVYTRDALGELEAAFDVGTAA